MIHINAVRFEGFVIDVVCTRRTLIGARASIDMKRIKGSSSDEFDEAIGKFALAYADQAERDYAALKATVRKGKVTIYQES